MQFPRWWLPIVLLGAVGVFIPPNAAPAENALVVAADDAVEVAIPADRRKSVERTIEPRGSGDGFEPTSSPRSEMHSSREEAIADLEAMGVVVERSPGRPSIRIDVRLGHERLMTLEEPIEQYVRQRDATNAAIPLIRELSGIKNISFCHCDTLSDAQFNSLDNLRDVLKLDLAYTAITNKSLRQIAKLETLGSLRLEGCKISDDGLHVLAGLNKLRWLNISHTSITDDGIRKLELRNFRKLERLDVAFTSLSPAAIRVIQELPELESLHLDGLSIGDPEASRLSDLKRLRVLTIRGTAITDTGLEFLTGLTGLTHLDLRGTSTTRKGISRVRQRLPLCWVIEERR